MNAETLACPGCGEPMERVVEPDLTFDRCGGCGGVFLDRGELNALATGMAGDIEFCSVEPDAAYEDRFPSRACPRCEGQAMRKEDLLVYSDLIFDHCATCHGWFLDGGEVEAMNRALAEIRKAQGGLPEYRERHRDHLVTVTETPAVVSGGADPFGMGGAVVTTTWRRVEVYFTKPLGAGLRVTLETWATRLLRFVGVRDVETGDEAFDGTFLVKADDAKEALGALGPRAREALLAFHGSPLAQLGKRRSFEVLDDRLLFAFSDWGERKAVPSAEQLRSLTDALVDVAVALEGA